MSTTIWPLLVVLSFVTIVLGSASMTMVVCPVAEAAGFATAGAAVAGFGASAGLGASAGFAASAGLLAALRVVVAGADLLVIQFLRT